jgi:hypothetical protein
MAANSSDCFALARDRDTVLPLQKIQLTEFVARNFLLTKIMARAKHFSPQ